MRRTIRERMHGTQQHPQVTIIATNTAIEIIKDIIKPFQCPNMPVINAKLNHNLKKDTKTSKCNIKYKMFAKRCLLGWEGSSTTPSERETQSLPPLPLLFFCLQLSGQTDPGLISLTRGLFCPFLGERSEIVFSCVFAQILLDLRKGSLRWFCSCTLAPVIPSITFALQPDCMGYPRCDLEWTGPPWL
ncbi:hypothetical protein CHARACLAT_033466 [Characodon lateralis]|uniref:Uncharacterized protein n=1 Tax=Characodon lateralis TaxID=208331 RepID=A0ABU7EQS5_9TELE|nr:hypothetical protein [Characodon lateralis]